MSKQIEFWEAIKHMQEGGECEYKSKQGNCGVNKIENGKLLFRWRNFRGVQSSNAEWMEDDSSFEEMMDACWSIATKKKNIAVAPAVFATARQGEIVISSALFRSREEAAKYFKDKLLKWPANDNSWCYIEVEE